MNIGGIFSLPHAFGSGFEVKADPRLCPGSLLLVEPARDGLTGIPGTLANYASVQAAEAVGSPVESLQVVDNLTENWPSLVERTAKGGLHGIVGLGSMGGPRTGASRWRFCARVPAALMSWLVARPSHAFYLSLIGQMTRDTASATFDLAGLHAAGSQDLASINQSITTKNVFGYPPASNARYLDGRLAQYSPFLSNIAVSSHTLSASFAATVREEFLCWGERSGSTVTVGAPSFVVYSAYLEDLTVSGRTYAEVDEIEKALFDERFAPGGRYDADSWTNPSTVA